MVELMKTARVLEGNLCNLFAVFMSLCNCDVNNQVESSNNFSKLEKELDSYGLLTTTKKLVYTGGTNDLNVRHNKAMAHMNLMNLYHDRFQDIKEFRDQYMAMRKVCNELGLKLGVVMT
jgi:hypothetical protein